ncbi:biotin-independent malonate decarboxylase subunit gamma [Schauerella aestuarii]|uniref:biotin-independent malonate decarboxylase subunit gamma n=1 Tax=Schauerella aestuarii TaxID=2511204 RepID=UPI0013688922|nr:biotin-independent malonate decarboxylase subunit gamma [Achromobacter aestuarii]MYZ44772.1 biotin-independent malonate decarboxylase subunit gamma [Achromobacter aestuarii]
MTFDDVMQSLFPSGHDVLEKDHLVFGSGTLPQAGRVAVIGVTAKAAVGVDEALVLSRHILDVVRGAAGVPCPILVLIDSDSQRMSKRDELMGLSQFLSHLALCLRVADARGHHTFGLLYGHTAAGAFIATALATRTLVAVPGAHPSVMDLPSMAKVTKLPLAVLEEKARSSPVFAPGLDNLAQTGAIAAVLDPATSLATQIDAMLLAAATESTTEGATESATASATVGASGATGDCAGGAQSANPAHTADTRDRLGLARGGRPKAAEIARRVYDAALAHA